VQQTWGQAAEELRFQSEYLRLKSISVIRKVRFDEFDNLQEEAHGSHKEEAKTRRNIKRVGTALPQV